MSTTDVTAGNFATGTVQAGDTLVVETLAGSEEVSVYGTETVAYEGLAVYTTVEAGGVLTSAGIASLTTVDAGGTFTNSGLSLGGTISGIEDVASGGSSVADTVNSGGSIVVAGGGTVEDATIAGGVLNVAASTADVTGTVAFSGTGGLLELSSAQDITNTITGFAGGDAISISGLSTTDGATLSVVDDSVTITDGSATYSLDIAGASGDNLTLTTVNGTLEVVCFLAGTRISTPTGGRAIELLRAGDMVRTSDGMVRPIRWLGRQTVMTRFADPLRVAPIRIRAEALGQGLPVHDLLVSTDHAILVDGVLVQAGALVNGVSIIREDAALPETLVYYHVELADHSLILAEGVAAETFIDNVDRLAFDNWDEHEAASDPAPMQEMTYPRAKSHRQVPQSLRARLMERGLALYGQDVAAVA